LRGTRHPWLANKDDKVEAENNKNEL
jgi:hypothetical protein